MSVTDTATVRVGHGSVNRIVAQNKNISLIFDLLFILTKNLIINMINQIFDNNLFD